MTKGIKELLAKINQGAKAGTWALRVTVSFEDQLMFLVADDEEGQAVTIESFENFEELEAYLKGWLAGMA